MKPGIRVEVTVGTLAQMTDEQFKALRDNVLAEDLWENAKGLYISGGADYIGVEPLDDVHSRIMFIGIERDGYTHS